MPGAVGDDVVQTMGKALGAGRRSWGGQVGRARRRVPPVVLSAALLVPICLVYLWFPGDGDQAVFEVGARRLSEGGVYYRDFWDIKQPGIYWFFQAGLSLGLGVVGPRLLEIAGVLGAGVLLWRVAAGWGVHPSVQVVAPVLVLGSYVLLSHRAGVTQIEGLLNPWLILVCALTWPVPPQGGPVRPVPRWALAGLATGVIAVLKPLYLPIPAVLLLGALAASRTSPSRRLTRLGAALACAALPVLATLAYLAWHGVLSLAWLTNVQLPVETSQQTELAAGWHRWKDLVVGPILPLAVVALLTARRRGTVVREVTLALTGLVAIALTVPQFPGQYRLLMLAAPFGLLAVVGADVVWRWVERARPGRPRRRLAVLLVAALLAVPLTWGPQRLIANAGDIEAWGLGEDARNARDFVLLGERHDLEVVDVRDRISPGTPVYVFGHAQVYELVDAVPAIAISGWDVDSKPSRVWRELDRELELARPAWIYIEHGYHGLIADRAPRLDGMLQTDYHLAATGRRGDWFRTDEPGRPCGVPCDNRLADQPGQPPAGWVPVGDVEFRPAQ